jgi:hypothetical protein
MKKITVEDICKLFGGVEIDEVFTISVPKVGVKSNYTIDGNGRLLLADEDQESSLSISQLATFEIIKSPYKPKRNEYYFYSEPSYPEGYDVSTWMDDETDKHRFENGLIFRTKEEAQEVSKTIIELLKASRGTISNE